MRLGQKGAIAPVEAISTGSISIDYALGIGGLPRGRVVEIFGPESSGKTTLALQVIAEAQKAGGMAAFVDAEHALDAQYAQKLGRRPRQPAGVAARQRRAGARNRRSADPLQQRRRGRRRLGGRARAQGRNRRRDGRRADGPAGAPDVAGAAQAHRRRLEVEDHAHLHQPAAREDRRDVRQPRNHHRRPRAQVLRVGAHRHPPHRQHQGRRPGGRRPHAREGGEEQDGAAVPRGRVRHHVRRGHLEAKATCSTWRSRSASSRRAARGSPTAASASARAARTPSSSSRTTRRCARPSRTACAASSASCATADTVAAAAAS